MTTDTTAPLSPEREQEIRETHPGEWYAGPWTQGDVDPGDGFDAYTRVVHQESGQVLATLPDWAGPIALFIADAHDAVPELLGEIDRLRQRITELERPAIEAERNQIRQSFMELSAQAREDRDCEGAFEVDCRLRDREEQWKREDAATTEPR